MTMPSLFFSGTTPSLSTSTTPSLSPSTTAVVTAVSADGGTRTAISPSWLPRVPRHSLPDHSPSAPGRNSSVRDDDGLPRHHFFRNVENRDEHDRDDYDYDDDYDDDDGSQSHDRRANLHFHSSPMSGHHCDTPKIERLREKKRDLERRATAIRLSSPRYGLVRRGHVDDGDDDDAGKCPITARREVGTRHDEVWTPGQRRRTRRSRSRCRRGSGEGTGGGDVRRGKSRSQSASARNRLREMHRFGFHNGNGRYGRGTGIGNERYGNERNGTGNGNITGTGTGSENVTHNDNSLSIIISKGNGNPALAKLREQKRNLEGRRLPTQPPEPIAEVGYHEKIQRDNNMHTPSSPSASASTATDDCSKPAAAAVTSIPLIPTLPSTPTTPRIAVAPSETEHELLHSDLPRQQPRVDAQPQTHPHPQPQAQPLHHFHPQSPETILHSHPVSHHCSSERHRILERRRQILLRLSHSSPAGSVASNASAAGVGSGSVGGDNNSLRRSGGDDRTHREEQIPKRLFGEQSRSPCPSTPTSPNRHGNDGSTTIPSTPTGLANCSAPPSSKEKITEIPPPSPSKTKSSSKFRFAEFDFSKRHDYFGKEKRDGDETSTTAQSQGTHDAAGIKGGTSGRGSGGVSGKYSEDRTTCSRRVGVGEVDDDDNKGGGGAEVRAEAAAIAGDTNINVSGMAALGLGVGLGVGIEGGGDTVSSLGSASYLQGPHPSSNHSVMSSMDIALQLESLKKQLEQHGETLNKLALGKSASTVKDGERMKDGYDDEGKDGDANDSVTGGAHGEEFGDTTSPLSASPVHETGRDDHDDLDVTPQANITNDERSPHGRPYEDECDNDNDNDNDDTNTTPYHDPLDDPITEVESLQLELFERNIQITQLLEKVAQLQSEISESTDHDVIESENIANCVGGPNGSTKKVKKKKVFSANFAFGEAKRAVKGSIHEVQDLETEFKTQMENFAGDFEKVLANLYDPEEDKEDNEEDGNVSCHLRGKHHELETVDEDDCSMVEGLHDGLPVDLAQRELIRFREEKATREDVSPEAISAESLLHDELKEAAAPGTQQVGQEVLFALPPSQDIKHETEGLKSPHSDTEDLLHTTHADTQHESTALNQPQRDQEDAPKPTAPAGNEPELETPEWQQTDQKDDAAPQPPSSISHESIKNTGLESPETASPERGPFYLHNDSPFSLEMINRQYPYPQHPPQSISNSHTTQYHSQNPPPSNLYTNTHTIATTVPSTSISNPLLSNSSSLQSLDSSTISAIRSIEKTLSKQKKKEKKGIHQLENELKSVREEIAQLASVLQRTTEAAAASAAISAGAHSQSQDRLGNGYSRGPAGGKKGKGRFKSLIHALSVRKRLTSPSKE